MAYQPPQGTRALSRNQALQLLFQAEGVKRPVRRVLEDEYLVTNGPASDYAQELACLCEDHLAQIDPVLAAYSERWALSRMHSVDRNILRLALYELLFEESVEDSVVINEAVKMAHDFGGDESYSFVNGILGRIVRDRAQGIDILRKGQEEVASEASEVENAWAGPEAADAALADDASAEAADSDISEA